MQGVVTQAAGQQVVPITAGEQVVTLVTLQQIVPAFALQIVGTIAALELVLALPPKELVVARLALDAVVAATAGEHVAIGGQIGADQAVRAPATHDLLDGIEVADLEVVGPGDDAEIPATAADRLEFHRPGLAPHQQAVRIVQIAAEADRRGLGAVGKLQHAVESGAAPEQHRVVALSGDHPGIRGEPHLQLQAALLHHQGAALAEAQRQIAAVG